MDLTCQDGKRNRVHHQTLRFTPITQIGLFALNGRPPDSDTRAQNCLWAIRNHG
jgi:hypothetical protein